MTDKIPMQSIQLVIAGSRHELVGTQAVVQTWEDANAKLREWASLDDRLQQIDFVVTFADGFTHDGSAQIGGPEGGDERVPFNDRLADRLRWAMKLRKGSFLDRLGENSAKAVMAGHFYDYGCDTSEPLREVANLLEPFYDGQNAGRDAGLTIVGSEDAPALVFADGDHIVLESEDDAAYLLRTWRIANGIHPIFGQNPDEPELGGTGPILGAGALRK